MAHIVRAVEQDLSDVLKLLTKVNLPVEGVADHFHNFFVAREDDRLLGCAGVEVYGDVGLIRSVAVHPSFQHRGLGRKLVERISNFAIENGLKEIYLITETAERFFSKLGYIIIQREDVNLEIKQSIEFSHVCATSGVCMMKTLR